MAEIFTSPGSHPVQSQRVEYVTVSLRGGKAPRGLPES